MDKSTCVYQVFSNIYLIGHVTRPQSNCPLWDDNADLNYQLFVSSAESRCQKYDGPFVRMFIETSFMETIKQTNNELFY